MPVPPEYQQAERVFERFLLRARDEAGLITTHQTYTMVQGVLQVYRRRLTLAQAVRFAGVLPPLLRALFVADWNPEEPRQAFGDMAAMNEEVRSLRPAHNFAPANAIQAVATALKSCVSSPDLQAILATFPPAAASFWDETV